MSARSTKSARGAKFSKVELRYAALHETNLAICLAAGFIGPRHEENVAYDQHAMAGMVVMTRQVPSAADLMAARGGLGYGGVAIVEIEITSPNGEDDPKQVPVAYVRRLIFPTPSVAKAFEARASGFGDVPTGIVPIVADSKLFPASELELVSPPVEPGSIDEPERNIRQPTASDLAYDRCAGLLAATFAAAEVGADASVLEALSAGGAELAASEGVEGLMFELARRLDVEKGVENYGQLLRSAVQLISDQVNGRAFSPASFIRALRDSGRFAESTPAGRFLELAGAIADLRRDIPESIFSNSESAIIPRGILLFLMNPDPDRLMAIRARTPDLGSRVFCMAAAMIGLRSGFTSLPATLKAPNRDAYLAVPLLTAHFVNARSQSIAFRRKWDQKGESESELQWNSMRLSGCKSPVDPEQSTLAQVLARMGLSAAFGEADGRLQIESEKRKFSFEYLPSVSFPRERTYVVTGTVLSSLPRKKVEALVASANATSIETGVFFETRESGRIRGFVARAFLKPSENGISEALAAVHAELDKIDNTNRPSTSDLFGG